MKKLSFILALLLLLSCLVITVSAEDEEIDYTQMSDIERLARGIIYVPENWTLEDFCEQMEIIDNSDGHFNTQKFAYLCYVIQQLYYKPMTIEEAFQAFLEKNGRFVDTNDMEKVYRDLFSILDKYSYYLSPDYAEKFWNPTTSKGVGITFIFDETGEVYGTPGTYVEGVAPDSSAAQAGILPGDRLISIMGIDTTNLPFAAVSAILSSLTDETHVELMYERVTEDEIITGDVTLERRATAFREVTFHLHPDRRAFVMTLDSFRNPYTHTEILERFKELKAAGYENAIIDLRDNPGGDVYVAANIISTFIKDERVIFTMGREGKLNFQVFKSTGGGVTFDSLHVLVNENTASSAEIMALCLEQHAGAVLVGTKTVGKGVAQSAGQLVDDSTFGVTTFVAYDHVGKTYNEKGLLPRLYVKNPVVQYSFPTDLEWFNYINYVEAHDGAENDVVMALERRLEIMGLMKSEFVDGLWDENTTNSVTALQLGEGLEPTGVLSEKLVVIITDIINSYKNYYYAEDLQLQTVFGRIY